MHDSIQEAFRKAEARQARTLPRWGWVLVLSCLAEQVKRERAIAARAKYTTTKEQHQRAAQMYQDIIDDLFEQVAS